MADDVALRNLRVEDLPAPEAWSVEYDKDTDTLFMVIGEARPGTSIDLNGELWVRVDPATNEILGFEIEAFREVFLARHPDLPRPTERRVSAPIEKAGWMQVFLAFVKNLTGDASNPNLAPTG